MKKGIRGRTGRRRLAWGLPLLAAVAPAACDTDDHLVMVDLCQPRALPFSAGGDAPVVTDVAIEVQPTGLVVLLTATDPQGSDDLVDVVQEVSLYADPGCSTVAATARDDLACSGCEESFGTLVDPTAAIYPQVAGAATWPVRVRVGDAGGHVTEGQVDARVVPPS